MRNYIDICMLSSMLYAYMKNYGLSLSHAFFIFELTIVYFCIYIYICIYCSSLSLTIILNLVWLSVIAFDRDEHHLEKQILISCTLVKNELSLLPSLSPFSSYFLLVVAESLIYIYISQDDSIKHKCMIVIVVVIW
jgi:hypothetical protein